MEPLTLSALAASALTQAFKFLYDRVGAALDRRVENKKSEAAEETDVLADPLRPLNPIPGALTSDRLARLHRARNEMAPYVAGKIISPDDHDLIQLLDRAREDLEAVYGQRFTFVGEQRPRAQVLVKQGHDEVMGAVTGIQATGVSGAVNVSVEQESKTVHEGGEVTGLRLEGPL
ncbi:hypothetical protein [Amycolatopsis pithecellobii]|uniref:Uncharacterized protein n=1 Tax=Amycolatopsis pithecellobii TaxID=664692 RepID=A0A6N7ZBI4_9PSEU|nr:hypothetical protein [Amycolatopsis pithecellobii]MTD59090.1 hypothetical protein [Amycolatopsis pithecellobii]